LGEKKKKTNDKPPAVFEPGKFSTALTTGATMATALGLFSVIDIIIKWIGG
jgi:hypothetical protein